MTVQLTNQDSWKLAQHILMVLSLLQLLLPALRPSTVAADGSTLKTDVFILGCNGDLAQRYLWPAFHRVWQQQPDQPLQLHCVTRGSLSSANPGTFLATAEPGLRDWFFANVRLHSGVGDEAGYRSLCSQAEAVPSRRIFYLSIPPRSYAQVARALQRACPPAPGGPASDFVLEKPFGSSAASAEQLTSELSAAGVTEDRLHRVDHYLAKPVLAGLTQFRQANPALESLLSSAYVIRVEAAIWENLGVEDRLDFYDSEGVIRDVMQNHLTEMLTLVLMELPPSQSPPPPDWLENEKSRLLTAYCPPVAARHLLAGRYSGYGGSRSTPTFAAVGLTFCGRARWHSVPIVASAGKRLAFKASFIRLTFQLPAPATGRSQEDELLVYIGGNAKATGLARPLIACSAGLRCSASADLHALPSNEALVHPELRDQDKSGLLRLPVTQYNFFSVSKSASENAYVQVAKQLLAKKASAASSCFVGLPSLLAAWQLWDPVLAAAAELPVSDDDENGFRVYQPNWLPDFTVDRLGRLDWSAEPKVTVSSAAAGAHATTSARGSASPRRVRFDRTLCDGLEDCSFLIHSGTPQSLSSQLAERIALKIKAAAGSHGDEHPDFHLALPGGQSAQLLMQSLATMARDDGSLADAIGHIVHIWLTDERCVLDDPDAAKLKSSSLNSAVIDRYFLHLLPAAARLPVSRLHFPRPASEDAADCRAASAAYSSEVNLWLRDRSGFDFVVLGVGADGHAASLFTDRDLSGIDCSLSLSTDCLSQSARFTSSPQAPQLRVSLTASEIARSNEVAFLLTGAAKQAALDSIASTSLNVEKPVYFRLLRLVGKDRARLWIDKALNCSGLVFR